MLPVTLSVSGCALIGIRQIGICVPSDCERRRVGRLIRASRFRVGSEIQISTLMIAYRSLAPCHLSSDGGLSSLNMMEEPGMVVGSRRSEAVNSRAKGLQSRRSDAKSFVSVETLAFGVQFGVHFGQSARVPLPRCYRH